MINKHKYSDENEKFIFDPLFDFVATLDRDKSSHYKSKCEYYLRAVDDYRVTTYIENELINSNKLKLSYKNSQSFINDKVYFIETDDQTYRVTLSDIMTSLSQYVLNRNVGIKSWITIKIIDKTND